MFNLLNSLRNLFQSPKNGAKRPSRRHLLQFDRLEERRLMSASPAFGIGSPFTDNLQVATASSANGRSISVWTKKDSDGDTDILAQRYRADGSEIGAIITVASTGGKEHDPAVAMDANGNFVVVWTRDRSSGNKDVRAQRFAADGSTLGSAISVAGSSTRNEFDADVAMDANGNFIISYTKDHPLYTTVSTALGKYTYQSGTDRDVHAKRFSSSGAVLNTISVGTSNSSKQEMPSVAASDDGRFVIAFRSAGDIWIKRYSSTGSFVATQSIDTTGTLADPDVAMDAAGNSVVVWEDSDDIRARRILSDGTLGMVITVRSTQVNGAPSVALTRDGTDFFVAYEHVISSGGLLARHVEVAHVSGSTPGQIEDFGVGYSRPDISVDGNEVYFVGYGDHFDPELLGRWGQTGATAPASKLDHDFDIDFFFSGGLTASQIALFQQAADRWEQIIRNDLSDVAGFVASGLTWNIDDLLIEVRGGVIDGAGRDTDGDGVIDTNTLSQATWDALRTDSKLPYHGVITFDSADLASIEGNGTLLGTIMHEMGHVLGIGSLWDEFDLVSGEGSTDPRYTGAKAVAAYNAARGIWGIIAPVTSVPVENTGGPGTADSHWRESVLGDELMTGFLEAAGTAMPISAITIGSLEDMGYSVRYDTADPFAVPTLELTGRVATGGLTAL